MKWFWITGLWDRCKFCERTKIKMLKNYRSGFCICPDCIKECKAVLDEVITVKY